ncbi:hypothetical protein NQ314_000685 [Rhamnusium bicolor]|uniref:Uncharacterized protein n=1 Tax=Rhamnusium bicolor TaxID=1586634 RepID=A0AAV8ZVH4_9CUCU|nr:hypothetical protein NQ314_000685 [Rhamnusium bicolor]
MSRHPIHIYFSLQKTGIPLQVAARLQLNLRLQPIHGISLYQDVPTVYFPVLWFEQVVVLPNTMAFMIKILVNFKVICWAISIILISAGVLIEVCAFYRLCTTNLFGRKKPISVIKEEVPLNQK